MKKSYIVISLILLVLIADQALKIWVKTSFCYGEDRPLFGNLPWARLNFVENPGMAFGWKLGGETGKLVLSIFRLIAISFLGYYLVGLLKKNVSTGLLVSFALILAGAIGNMIDSAFYGMLFSESDFHCANGAAKLFPEGGGYEKFLHGKVVDMLFFPLWHNAQHEVLFFQPVFNIADSAITTGVLSILVFQRSYFSNLEEQAASQEKLENEQEDSKIAENTVAFETITNDFTEKSELKDNITETKNQEN